MTTKIKVFKTRSFNAALFLAEETLKSFQLYEASCLNGKKRIAMQYSDFYFVSSDKIMYTVNTVNGFNFLKEFDPISTLSNQPLRLVELVGSYLVFTDQYVDQEQAKKLQAENVNYYFSKHI
jgi:hypothetical protein